MLYGSIGRLVVALAFFRFVPANTYVCWLEYLRFVCPIRRHAAIVPKYSTAGLSILIALAAYIYSVDVRSWPDAVVRTYSHAH